MLLRALILVLLLANLAFLAWSQGWLEPMAGPATRAGREPERLQRQVAPQLVQASPAVAKAASAASAPSPSASAAGLVASAPSPNVTAAASAAGTASAPASATVQAANVKATAPAASAAVAAKAAPTALCLESAPIDGDDAWRAATAALERAGVPASSYSDQRSMAPPVWAVVTIRLFSKDFGARKEETLKRLKVPYEPLKGFPEEDPSLLISRHESEAAANKALDALTQRYLKGLRVMQIKPAVPRHRVRIAQADAALQTKLAQLKEPTLGSGFAPCAPAKPG